ASGLTTEFSQDEFVPRGSEAERLIGVVDGLFGGDVVEQTGVVITGSLFDPDVANAMLQTEANMAGTTDVRMAGARAQALSPASAVLLARQVAAESDPGAAARFGELGLGEASFAPDADVVGLLMLAADYVPADLGSVVATDGSVAAIRVSTSAGEEGADALAAALLEDAAPLVDAGVRVTVTSRNLLIGEVSTTLTAAQRRSIIITLAAAFVLLVLYYAVTERRPMLGVVTMIPSLLVVAWTLGTMRLMGLSFNVLTGTVASLAIGIGVPYGIHVTHRFTEDLKRSGNAIEAIQATVGHTGAALAGAALTTAAGFGVLWFASIVPLQQFGAMTAITIVYSLAASVLAQPSCLVMWDRATRRRPTRRT
ncbi:MAG: MMPL family transporter, partial [Actinomycetota bacterium]